MFVPIRLVYIFLRSTPLVKVIFDKKNALSVYFVEKFKLWSDIYEGLLFNESEKFIAWPQSVRITMQ